MLFLDDLMLYKRLKSLTKYNIEETNTYTCLLEFLTELKGLHLTN